MKKLLGIFFALVLSLAIFNVSAVMASTTYTFNSAPVSDLITENSGIYSGSVPYTPSWVPGNVTSAKLTLSLSDDVSTILQSYSSIDIPREWAEVSNIRDGGLNLGGAPINFEVEHTSPLFNAANVDPFNTVFPGSDGFENPLTTSPITNASIFAAATTGFGIILPSVREYEIDVTTLMNSAGLSGSLAFDLRALNLYSTSALPTAFLIAVAPFGFNPLQPQTTLEDYLFTGAQLSVSAVPEPSMLSLLALGLFGMFMGRKWLHKNS